MRTKALLCLMALAVVSSASLAPAQDATKSEKRHHYSFDVSTNTTDSFECSEALRVSSSDLPAVQYGEETQAFANVPLRIEAARHGGISVRQGTGNQIEVKLCKAALAETDAEALRLLGQVHLSAESNTVSASGPGREENARWVAQLLVRAPQGATLDLNAHNGGISVREFSGNVTARTTNGGISLKKAGGQIEAATMNGGISLQESSGNVRLSAQNGGLSLKLGDGWEAGTLTAETHNGGVSVEVGRAFYTPMEVAVRGHGGLQCSAAVCEGAERGSERKPRVMRLGGGAEPVVRASTHNGGVTVRDPDSARGSRMF